MVLDHATLGNGATPPELRLEPAEPPAPPPPPGKRIPDAGTEWVDMPAPYEGLRLRLWLDFTERHWQAMGSDDEAEQQAMLQRIVLEHDGWADAAGLLPQPSDPAFWERISLRMMTAILAVARAEATKPPPALLARRRTG